MEAPSAEDAAQVATRRIVEAFDPLQVVLFGSRARGDYHGESDTDLLVVLPHVDDKQATTVAVRRLLHDLPTAKDVVVTTPEEIGRRGLLVGTILRPALREGTVLYMNEREKNEEARRWLRYAAEDLQTAQRIVDDAELPARNACYQAQQAAEKAIKAVFVFLQTDFPFTHDLERLRGQLPGGWQVKETPPEPLDALSGWAAAARYPGAVPEATSEAAREAVCQAEAVLDAVQTDLIERGLQEPPENRSE